MPSGSRRLAALLLCVLLTGLLCPQAMADLTPYGAGRLRQWVLSFDSFFEMIRSEVGGQTLMLRDPSPLDLPDGSVVILMHEQAVAIRCGDLSRSYSIEDELLFHVFASQLVCQPILNEDLLSDGVSVAMIAEDQPLVYADAALLQAYIEAFADAYGEEQEPQQ